jgi:uncharacterized protein YidB (DUF937 family)
MGTLDSILTDVGNEFGLSNSKTTAVLSELLSMMNDSPGGFHAFLDRLCKAGLNDFVSSWVRGISPRPISSSTLEAAIGRDPVEKIASRAGLSTSAASSVVAYMLPVIVQRLTPGGVIPSYLPDEVRSYGNSPTAAVAASARQAAYATEMVVRRVGAPPGLWPLIFFVVVSLLGYWYWSSRHHAKSSSSNPQQSATLGAQFFVGGSPLFTLSREGLDPSRQALTILPLR